MAIHDIERAGVLTEALPYIQKYAGKTIVVKYGGNAMINEELKDAVMSDIVLLSLVGIHVVLVHGGGPEITDMLHRVGKESRFVNGLRYTDEETVEIAQMVLAGKINKNLVALLQHCGGNAIGLCGIDGRLLTVKKVEAEEDIGFVGEPVAVNAKPINDLLSLGYIPVISTVGCDENGQVYNVNADTAAAVIAGALDAENLILMTDIKGLLRDVHDEDSLIPVVSVEEVPELMASGVISGGMLPKIECCVEAIRSGVKKTFIIDGRRPHSILIELFSKEGSGTMFI